MEIVDQTKFIIGVAFAAVGVAVLLSDRRSRGFGQRRQMGALLLVAALVFVLIGLGQLEL